MTERITWTQNTGIGRSGWDGAVGNRKLFTIERSVVRGEGWKLRTKLPVILRSGADTNERDDALKATAERVLARFVRSLGADWPEE